ncbi:MAG TPA: IS21 family transposase [Acidimicrobiales bacterium]|nr:IS21 family transposase [Acidimicrobiales bacterium]
MHEIREVLRLWLRGEAERAIARMALVDRKTVRRYVGAARAAGLVRSGTEDALTDTLIGVVCETVRPHRPDGHGEAWAVLKAHHDQLERWLKTDRLNVVKVHDLLVRQGVVVPQRTLHRYALEVLGVGRSSRERTVRVADGEPGVECQVDFGRMGLIPDPATGRRRVVWALIFTAVYSRHTFVYLSFRQTTEAVIEGCEAAWAFFGGVFKVIIPDNMSAIVDDSDPLEPRLNTAFVEYAQSRGFLIDPARVRKPQDKPRVERVVSFTRDSMFAGEVFIDIDHAQRHAERWCRNRAGLRTHGTTQCRPAELFSIEEQPHLLPVPTKPYDLPVYSEPKVARDHHVEVARAIYSVPGDLIGARVKARADSALVRIFHRGVLVKVHPRKPPGGRSTDPADLPAEKTTYALRDIDHLRNLAAGHGPVIGAYASALLDSPLPWTKMRQVYALLGLVKRWGPERVEAACSRALEAEAISVPLIGRMIERATESAPAAPPARRGTETARFARDLSHFATARSNDTDTGQPELFGTGAMA